MISYYTFSSSNKMIVLEKILVRSLNIILGRNIANCILWNIFMTTVSKSMNPYAVLVLLRPRISLSVIQLVFCVRNNFAMHEGIGLIIQTCVHPNQCHGVSGAIRRSCPSMSVSHLEINVQMIIISHLRSTLEIQRLDIILYFTNIYM